MRRTCIFSDEPSPTFTRKSTTSLFHHYIQAWHLKRSMPHSFRKLTITRHHCSRVKCQLCTQSCRITSTSWNEIITTCENSTYTGIARLIYQKLPFSNLWARQSSSERCHLSSSLHCCIISSQCLPCQSGSNLNLLLNLLARTFRASSNIFCSQLCRKRRQRSPYTHAAT
jgi:hypothetical protein